MAFEPLGRLSPGARHGPHSPFLGVLGSLGAFACGHGAGQRAIVLATGWSFRRPIVAGLTQGRHQGLKLLFPLAD